MKLFLSCRRIPYEGGSLLGVYRSEEAAQTRIDDYKKELSHASSYASHINYSVEEVETGIDLTDFWF